MDKKVDRLLFTARGLCADINWKKVWLIVLIAYAAGIFLVPVIVYYLIFAGGN